MAEEELIDDAYQMVMCVASGSNSQVWEVAEKGTGRHLAMKLLKKEVPEFKQNKSKMKLEATILKSLDHPLIVKFDKFSSNRDHTYILMEYFRASNLKLQIKNETNKVHLRVRPLLEGVCSALAHVHSKGFIHRDIKPDNVLLNRAGEVRLVDFSLAMKEVKGFGRYFAGRPKEIQGTRTYIAPETIRKSLPTIQTDLYSLGILFFEVLTCKTPFPATTPEELLQKHLRMEPPVASFYNSNVSPEMDRLIGRLLKKKPAERPASADEVLAELKRIRIFKEDIIDEEAKKKQDEDADAIKMLSELRLDSRADAKLKEMLATNPDFAKKFQEAKQTKSDKKKADAKSLADRIKTAGDAEDARLLAKKGGKPPVAAPAAPAAAVPQPLPPQMPMPGYPMPGYPGMPQTFAPYPQMQPAMPPGMPPGMYPQTPGAPQYPAPPQAAYPQPAQRPPMPGSPQPQMVPPGARQPAPPAGAIPPQRPQPVAPPANPAAAAASRPAPKPAQPAQPATDLDFMTDLPDVV